MTEKFGLDGIWEDLNKYLQVTVETCEDRSNQLPLVIRFTVANTAQTPQIVFEEVQLMVGVPPDIHVEKTANLANGETFIYEHRCSYGDLVEMQYSVEGAVNPTSLFHIQQQYRKIPGSRQNLSIIAYVGILKEINIHKWLTDTLKTLPIPGPDTTLSELKAQQEKLSNAIHEIREAEQKIQKIFEFVRKDEKLVQHRKLVAEYLNRTAKGFGELRLMFINHNLRYLESKRDSIVTRLSQEAITLDEATKGLS